MNRRRFLGSTLLGSLSTLRGPCALSAMIGAPAKASGSLQTRASSSWRLRTEDTEVYFSMHDGRPVAKVLSARATGQNWLSSPIREQLMTTVLLDGVSAGTDWKFEGAVEDHRGGEVIFRYRNTKPSLELRSIWRARPGRGPVEHWATIKNLSGRTVTVTHQDSLALGGLALTSGESAQAWWINRGANTPDLKGGMFTPNVDSDLDQILVSDPTKGASPVPWMAVQVGGKHGLYVGWEFSGIGRIHVKTVVENPARFDLQVGLLPDFKTDIATGETFWVPPAFVGCYRGSLDEGSYTLHRFILDKLLPSLPKDQPYPTLAYNLYLDAGGNKAREKNVLQSAAICKKLGFETFVPDAMWYPEDGDWRWDPERFPQGGGPIADYAHQKGMRLGLWCAWTHGGTSHAPGATNIQQHLDWFNQKPGPKWKPEYINWSPLMDLGCSAAEEWAKEKTQQVVAENHLDYLKHDFSPIVTECEQTNHRHRYGTDVSYWSTQGYYEVQEALKRKFPDLVLEGCSGGGHIKDFGYIKRVHYIVTTDTLSALPDRQSIYDSTFAFPPAVLMAYTYDNFYNRTSDRPGPYLWRSAMMSAWQIDPTDTATWTDREIRDAKRSTQIYKSWVRPILNDCEVHHILPRPDGIHWDGMFYWSRRLKRGTVYIFRPNNDQVTMRFRLRGLEAGGQYNIRSEDGSVSQGVLNGAQLMSQGLTVRLPHKYSSDLIYVEQDD